MFLPLLLLASAHASPLVSATMTATPPEGEPVSVELYLGRDASIRRTDRRGHLISSLDVKTDVNPGVTPEQVSVEWEFCWSSHRETTCTSRSFAYDNMPAGSWDIGTWRGGDYLEGIRFEWGGYTEPE